MIHMGLGEGAERGVRQTMTFPFINIYVSLKDSCTRSKRLVFYCGSL